MAKKTTKTGGTAKKSAKAKPAKTSGSKSKSKSRTVARRPARGRSDSGAGDALRKLLESPLVAELLAVGATAALAAIAQHGFGKGEGKGTSKALKQAGKAAAAAMGKKLSSEFDEIRKASVQARTGAKS